MRETQKKSERAQRERKKHVLWQDGGKACSAGNDGAVRGTEEWSDLRSGTRPLLIIYKFKKKKKERKRSRCRFPSDGLLPHDDSQQRLI